MHSVAYNSSLLYNSKEKSPENLQRLKSIHVKYDLDEVHTDLMPSGWKVA